MGTVRLPRLYTLRGAAVGLPLRARLPPRCAERRFVELRAEPGVARRLFTCTDRGGARLLRRPVPDCLSKSAPLAKPAANVGLMVPLSTSLTDLPSLIPCAADDMKPLATFLTTLPIAGPNRVNHPRNTSPKPSPFCLLPWKTSAPPFWAFQ